MKRLKVVAVTRNGGRKPYPGTIPSVDNVGMFVTMARADGDSYVSVEDEDDNVVLTVVASTGEYIYPA